MNLPRIHLIAILLLAFGVGANGQEAPKAILVDEHGLVPCDDTLGRLDAWYADLSNNPGSTGLAVISSPREKKYLAVFRQHLMDSYAKWRKASEELRLKYVRSNSNEDLKVQLWRIPAGADGPQIENMDNSFSLPDTVKPLMLAKEYPNYLMDNICPGEPADQRIFVAFLNGNRSARGNIVVRERTRPKAQAKAERILRTFRRKYGIPRSRLRVFLRTRSNPSNNLEPIVEYWYLP